MNWKMASRYVFLLLIVIGAVWDFYAMSKDPDASFSNQIYQMTMSGHRWTLMIPVLFGIIIGHLFMSMDAPVDK